MSATLTDCAIHQLVSRFNVDVQEEASVVLLTLTLYLERRPFDTHVADYLPDSTEPTRRKQVSKFKPAETFVTLKHLLTLTSGLFYPTGRDVAKMMKGYSSKEKHPSEDPTLYPTSEFFRIVIARLFFLQFLAGIHVKSFF